MANNYPPNPDNVPADLYKPSSAYKRRAWVAMLILLIFVFLYVSISVFFGWKSFTFIKSAIEGSGDVQFLGFVIGIPCAFLAIFLIKALFFVKKGDVDGSEEIFPEQEPELFAFIHKLAEDANAPKPYRVFLSRDVNAAVFYDLSIFNLLFSSKKNLVIGLGLVNSVSLDEFKAVLAHEFGHFAQRSMAVGRWVYIAHQIAGHIIAERGVLDNILRFISNFDLRVAWIGWLLQLIVWSIRSVVETIFSLVVITQRALSREMEFQADLVSVSLTGSDSLIHALHKLSAADESWNSSLQIFHKQAVNKKAIHNIFEIQSYISQKIGGILADPLYGKIKDVPVSNPENHRIIKKDLAQPPAMWSTHPENSDREENAKKVYIPSKLDKRSPWILFSDAEKFQKKETEKLIDLIAVEDTKIEENLNSEESKNIVDEDFSLIYLDTKYRGTYLGRSITSSAKVSEDLLDENMKVDNLKEGLEKLYPEELSEKLKKMKSLEEEAVLLEALNDDLLTAPGGVIKFRGNEISKQDLPNIIGDVKEETVIARGIVEDHDKKCRSYHYLAAGKYSGWQTRLKSLLKLLHYTEHQIADLNDAQKLFHNTFSIVTADNNVSTKELSRLVRDGNILHDRLLAIKDEAKSIKLDSKTRQKIKLKSWEEAFKDFDLPPANSENINDWLNVITSWVDLFVGALDELRSITLENLLESEDKVKESYLNDSDLEKPETPVLLLKLYNTLLPGKEREIQKKLGVWDRFATADGFFPACLRFSIAAIIIIGVIVTTQMTGSSKVTSYNGLNIDVRVSVNGESKLIRPYKYKEFNIQNSESVEITAHTPDNKLIEKFNESISGSFSSYIYNINRASPLIEWTAVYGAVSEKPTLFLGNPRWKATSVEFLFREPPKTVSTSSRSSGTTRQAISGFDNANPLLLTQYMQDGESIVDLSLSHFKWDPSESMHYMIWGNLAASSPKFKEYLKKRLELEPNNVVLRRLELDNAKDNELELVRRKHKELYVNNPSNSDLAYVSTRSIEDRNLKSKAFLEAYAKYPDNPWLANAAAYTLSERNDWLAALNAYEKAYKGLSSLREYLAVEIYRLKRWHKEPTSIQLAELEKESLQIMQFVGYEKLGDNPIDIIYDNIKKNKVEEAKMLMRKKPDIHLSDLLRLAMSKNVPEDLYIDLLETPTKNLDSEIVIAYVITLRLKHNMKISDHLKTLDELSENKSQKIISFAKSTSSNYKDDLNGLSLKWKVLSMVMQNKLSNYKNEKDFSHIISSILFKSEKPLSTK
jgi:Zn-dependent protease with chaperone function